MFHNLWVPLSLFDSSLSMYYLDLSIALFNWLLLQTKGYCIFYDGIITTSCLILISSYFFYPIHYRVLNKLMVGWGDNSHFMDLKTRRLHYRRWGIQHQKIGKYDGPIYQNRESYGANKHDYISIKAYQWHLFLSNFFGVYLHV